MIINTRLAFGLILLLSLSLTACRAAREPLRPESLGNLPAVPAEDGALDISIVHPPPNQVRPNVDSTFVFGDVGTGRAELTINDRPVPVAANGGFLAYVRIPRDGTLRFEARADGEIDTATYTYREPERRAPQPTPITPPRIGYVVSEGRDTVDTGSETSYATTAPNGDRLWFMLPDTRVKVTGRLGDQLQVELAPGRSAWMPQSGVNLTDSAAAASPTVTSVEVEPASRHVDFRIAGAIPPFLVSSTEEGALLTIYGVDATSAPALQVDDPWVRSAVVAGASADSMQIALDLATPLWGYKAFHEGDSTLVVRLRKSPEPGAQPLSGMRILVDPGHPPGGATGPTRLAEAEANLRISLQLRDLLEARGAEVLMTRTDETPLVSRSDTAEELWARVRMAVEEDADLLVSVHNNAFPDGVNPFENHGTEVYYFNDFAEDLARYLVEEIAGVTGIPNNGALRRSLALARPTWMPSVLTESLYMMFPQQEAALRDPEFVQSLAEAHLRGIERFVEGKLAGDR